MKFPFRSLVFLILATTAAFAQSDQITSNENLAAEGIPKIPAALAESASRYSDYRTAGFNSWHPSRREMLIETGPILWTHPRIPHTA
jgi:hypothetical protein